MNIEARLIERIGPVGGKLHTARSRNDQVALDVRLYLRDEVQTVLGYLDRLQESLLDQAEANLAVIMPGFTHLQTAQPILFAHHLLAYYEMFRRDAGRMADLLARFNYLPLGAGALAGTTFPIDREFVAEQLGFAGVTRNSLDSVSDRDFAIEFCAASSILMMHLSRLSEELILWSSADFDFIELSDAFCTGSSIMPQKKNPDVPELVRGKTGRVYGNLMSLLTLMKSLPLAYNKDMQEDKEPLFDTIDTVKGSLKIFADMIAQMRVKAENMRRRRRPGLLHRHRRRGLRGAQGDPLPPGPRDRRQDGALLHRERKGHPRADPGGVPAVLRPLSRRTSTISSPSRPRSMPAAPRAAPPARPWSGRLARARAERKAKP